MSSRSQKQLAAKILKCGTTRIWFDPSRKEDIAEALTAADMKALIKDGVVRKVQKQGVSGYRKKKTQNQKKKGRQKGTGSKKGRKTTRLPKKKTWIKKIRTMRKQLIELKESQSIDNRTYRNVYVKAKSGFFRNTGHMKIYLERNNLIKRGEDHAQKKKEKINKL